MGLKHRQILTEKIKPAGLLTRMNVATCDILSAESEFYAKRSMLEHTTSRLSVSQLVSYGQQLG